MYSNSSSFLGGANSGRTGPAAYGQTPFSNIQPQSNGFIPQPTGFAGAQIQPQYTGLPGQGSGPQQAFQAPLQQPQFTAYPQQNQQSFQNSSSLQNPNFQQQQTGPASQNQISSQRTGQTSAQIAQSFQPTPSTPTTASKPSTTGTKIPKIRLSFLTAQDQAKFEQLFKSAVGSGQALDGDKVRDLLIRSKLPGSDLMHIWVLSDTTKSGQLLFPEFAVAMYLCNMKLVGKDLPQTLPERIANEVSSMVDIISFGVPDDRPQAPRSNAPNFDPPPPSTSSLSIQQPQPQVSNSQLLTQLTSQPTVFASQYIPPQPTGFPQQSPGQTSQQSAFRPQATGFQQSPQAPSYSGLHPSILAVPTGFNSNLPQSQINALPQSLNAQPTGVPGQWGLVNAPPSGLPNIDALQQRMMPQPGREGGFTTAGLSGSATVPWAVTKDEKKIYDELFKAWDGFNKGFIGGEVAIEVMGQSGLEKSDLEKIWTLSDPGNRGRLDKDEFAVAMHLIYRKLNGYPVPNRLPPELVPPSTRNFADSIGTVKSLLSQDAEIRKNTGAFLQPQKTGVSYLKNHSFRSDSNGLTQGRKDATVFRNNDDDIGYKSSARRRLGGGGRTPSPVQPVSPASEGSNEEYSVEHLRKKIREKQILLDAIDFQDESNADEDDILDRKDRREAEDLYHRIRRCQEEIDSHPNSTLRLVDSRAERRALKRQLQSLTDKLPDLASHVRKTERSIADAKLELFRLRDAKEHPNAASAIIGTGPGGAITEADRLKARAKAMMQQRSAALTGRKSTFEVDDASAAPKRLDAEQSRIRAEKENNERMIKDVEDSVREFSLGLEDSLEEGTEDSSNEHEKRRWEEGLGVEDDVKEFIFDLQRSSRSAKIRQEETGRTRPDSKLRTASRLQENGRDSLAKETQNSAPGNAVISRPSANSTSAGSSYSSYKTAEERAAFIKQQAEQRMAERLAALGLKPPTKPGESTMQRQDREAKEREERVRQAEAEDAKRDHERQRRLAEEDPSATNVSKPSTKKPPPPPSRKSRAESVDQSVETSRRGDGKDLLLKAEQEGKEEAIKEQQKAQRLETKGMENEAQRQEEELAVERKAAQARLKALEDQVKAGKIRKQEEKRRRQGAEKEAREKEAKLAAQRAELEAAKERERQLQLQLENLEDEDSSDDDGPQEITPQETTPTNSIILPKETASSPEGPATPSQVTSTTEPRPSSYLPSTVPAQTLPAVPSSSYNSDTKNPFFKKLSQSNETSATVAAQSQSSVTSPTPNEVSTNPFHRLTQQENSMKAMPPLSSTPTGSRHSRRRPEEDEWSVVDSTEDSSEDDENERPTGGSAKQLASMLFGTMAPPRPLSAMDDKKSPTAAIGDLTMTPTMSPPPMTSTGSAGPFSAPPSPPPMPTLSAPPGGPPPPPPMPGLFSGPPSAPAPPVPHQDYVSGAAAAGPPAVGALLGDIVKGRGLKKVETRDRSQASVAGKVLG